MTMRTTTGTVTFGRPFLLDGLDMPQPAGDYQIETDEELLESVSFIGYRRMSVLIRLHPDARRPGIIQEMTIDPIALDKALAADKRIGKPDLQCQSDEPVL